MQRKDLLRNIRSLSSDEIKDLVKGKKSPETIKSELKWTPMDQEWLDLMKERGISSDNYPQYKPLIDILLSVGGDEVLIPGGKEDDYEDIMRYGQFWDSENTVFGNGEANQCHSNSAQLWSECPDRYIICTGYALSDDGLWRQHSWVMLPRARINSIIETTEKRIAYFGFAMSYNRANKFALQNIW